MRNDDELHPTPATTPTTTPTTDARVSRRLLALLEDDLPAAVTAWADGQVGPMHLRILAVQAGHLPASLRPCFDELGTAIARELSWRAFLPVAAKLRRHLREDH